MENFKVHFHKTPEDEKEIVLKIIESEKNEGLKHIDGEIKKTEEELRSIEVFNELIQKEIKELGLVYDKSIKPDQVHMVDTKTAKILGIKLGGQDSQTQSIVVDKSYFIEKNDLYDFYTAILHEMIHGLSFSSIIVQGDTRHIDKYRSGYKSMNPINAHKKGEKHNHFNGLNEAVTQKLTIELIIKHKDLINKELNLSDEMFEKSKLFVAYRKEITILDSIIEQVALFHNINESELWTKLKKGLFNGEMMFLRDFEKAMGSGFLRGHSK